MVHDAIAAPGIEMGSVIFRCPARGIKVQGWIAEDVGAGGADGEFVGIKCTACSQMHMINAATGKVLGERHGQNQDD
jgi:hypothetical protein